MKSIRVALAVALLVGGYLLASRIDFDDEVTRGEESRRAAEERAIATLIREHTLPLSMPVAQQ